MRAVCVVAVIGVALVASCGGSSDAIRDRPSTAPTTTIPPLRVGDTARHAVVETARTYDDHVLDQRGISLPAGNHSVAQIRACATATSPPTQIAATDFVLTLADGQNLVGSVDDNFATPLRSTRLNPSQCVTGNVSWTTPDAQTVARSLTDTKRRVTWEIVCPKTLSTCVDPIPGGTATVSPPPIPVTLAPGTP